MIVIVATVYIFFQNLSRFLLGRKVIYILKNASDTMYRYFLISFKPILVKFKLKASAAVLFWAYTFQTYFSQIQTRYSSVAAQSNQQGFKPILVKFKQVFNLTTAHI